MDALSEALLAVRTTGAIFIRVECIAPWGFAVPDVCKTADLLAPGTGRIVNYHLVTEGRALVRLEGKEAFWAEAGDIVILPYGDAHTVSNGRPSRYVDSAVAPGQLFTARPGTIRLGGGEGETTRIICGFIGCQRSADRLFLSGLPHSIRIKLGGEPSDSWLTRTIEHLVREAEADQPGASILLSRAAESIFVDALRRFMRGLSPEHTGWLAAARDTVVGAALATLQRAPARSWTIEQLAREVGSSPSALNKRFLHFLGERPASYLRHWRLHLAADKLGSTRDTVLQIAADVGYDSEAAFNRAFKAEFGVPPARYRKQITMRSRSSNDPAKTVTRP